MIKWTILAIFLFSCTNSNLKKKQLPVIEISDTLSKVNQPQYWSDTCFHKISCGLFINMYGDLGFKDFDKPECDSCWGRVVFITNAYLCKKKNSIKLEDRNIEDYTYIPLKDLIDTSSFVFLNDLYFKDKNRVYFFHNFQEGGIIEEVENADIKSFRTYKDTLLRLGFDKYHFYDGIEKIPKEDVLKYGLKRSL